MRTVKIYLLLLLTVSFLTSQAQFYSKRSVLFGGTSNGVISSIQVVNDTIYAMCAITDTVPPYKFIGVFNRYDKDGEVLSKQIFDIQSQNVIGTDHNTLLRSNDGGFAYGGYCYTATDNSLMLIKYDKNGAFQWYKTFSDAGAYLDLYVNSSAQDAFSNYYLAGNLQRRGTYDLDNFVAKIDSAGNLIFFKTFYNPNYSDDTWSICVNRNQNILLSSEMGSRNVDGGMFIEFNLLDTGGNLLNHIIGTDSSGPASYCTMPDYAGGYILAGAALCAHDSTHTFFNGNISKFDSNFHLIWSRDLGPCGGYNTILFSLKQLLDSNYLAVGQWYDPADTNGIHKFGWLVKFTPDGTVLWERKYRGVYNPDPRGDENGLLTLDLFSDNSIVAAGVAFNKSATRNSQQGWLLHLDTAGCLPDSNTCGIVNGIKEPQATASGSIHLYPNPSSGQVTFDYILEGGGISHLAIYDILGRPVYSTDINDLYGNFTIDVRHWSEGLYSYHVTDHRGYPIAGSFVVSH